MNYNIKEEQKKIKNKLDTLSSSIKIENKDTIEQAIKNAKLEVNEWQEVDNIVCVFSDLQNSTQISLDKNKTTIAKILENLIVPIQDIHRSFDCEFIDIKGDGGIVLYSGKNASIRAFLASVTCNTFFSEFASKLEKDYNIKFNVYSGIHKGSILLKRVGSRKDNFPVWAGDTVNISALITKELKNNTKISSSYIGVTDEVFKILSNSNVKDYLTISCGCNSSTKNTLWNAHTFKGRNGKKYHYMNTNWCSLHGQIYLDNVLKYF